MYSPRLACVALWLFAAVSVASLRAETVTILNDTFADGERLTHSLPGSAAWYQNTGVAGNLTVRSGTLDLGVANLSRTLWTYFPAVNLKVGESITLALDFSLTAAASTGFRIGLCYTNGEGTRIGDGPSPTGNYQGYGLENFFLIKRDGPAAANADATLINQLSLGDPGTPVWNRIEPNNRGIRGTPLQADTAYSLTLKVTRTGAGSANLTTTLIGGGLTSANTTTVADPANAFTSFDTLVVGLVGGTTSGDFLLTRAALTADVVPSTAGRLINMSIRTNAGTGDNTLIVGVGIGGAGTIGTKPALFRGIGPTLTAFGISGALADPIITAFQSSTPVAQNDNWGGGFDFATVGAFALSGSAPRDAALFNVAVPTGSYSLQITGRNNATGIALAEIYDATPAAMFTSTTPRLVNVSARTQVGTSDNILIAGFVVGGSSRVHVLIRAVGPTLAGFGLNGALADPKLEVFNGASLKASNDNWLADDAAAFASVGAFPLTPGSRDAALVTSLDPGNYTAQVSGVGNTTGIALVEVYELP